MNSRLGTHTSHASNCRNSYSWKNGLSCCCNTRRFGSEPRVYDILQWTLHFIFSRSGGEANNTHEHRYEGHVCSLLKSWALSLAACCICSSSLSAAFRRCLSSRTCIDGTCSLFFDSGDECGHGTRDSSWLDCLARRTKWSRRSRQSAVGRVHFCGTWVFWREHIFWIGSYM